MTTPLSVIQVVPTVSEVYGGPAVCAVALNEALRARNVDAEVFATSLETRRGKRMAATDLARLTAGPMRVRVFAPNRPYWLMVSWRMLMPLLRAVRRADFVHIHGQYLFPHIVSYLLARAFRKPYGVELHGSLEPYHRAKSRLKKALFDTLVGRRLLDRASYVMVVSQSEAESVSDRVSADRLLLAPLGVSLPPPQPAAGLARQIGVVPRERRVLFLGRLTKKKQPAVLIRAWAMTPGRETGLLVMAGPDDDFSKSDLSRLCAELGVANSVVLPGVVVGPEKAWLYESCGIFILPSQNENFALTVVEAMAGGCYVVGSHDVAAMRYVQLARGGALLDHVSADRIAATLGDLLTDKPCVEAGGARGRRYAASELGWQPTAAKVEDRIRAVLSRPSGASVGADHPDPVATLGHRR